jgi:hypothetical protein
VAEERKWGEGGVGRERPPLSLAPGEQCASLCPPASASSLAALSDFHARVSRAPLAPSAGDWRFLVQCCWHSESSAEEGGRERENEDRRGGQGEERVT